VRAELTAETPPLSTRQILPTDPLIPPRPFRGRPSTLPPGTIPAPVNSIQDGPAVGTQRRARSSAGNAGVRDWSYVARLDPSEDHGHRQDARAGAACGARGRPGRGVYPARGRVLLLCVAARYGISCGADGQTLLSGSPLGQECHAPRVCGCRRWHGGVGKANAMNRKAKVVQSGTGHAYGSWSDVDRS